MDWLISLLQTGSAVQTLIVLSIICSAGLALGKVRCAGISLGIACVFFVGILAGALGLRANLEMVSFAETLGLGIFIYALGLHVGPNFFSQFRHEGLPLNLWALATVAVGTLLAVVISRYSSISLTDMVGILCGATTNTPALGAAQQALSSHGAPVGSIALATAVTYPMGVMGVIIAIAIIRKIVAKPAQLKPIKTNDENHTFIGQYTVKNEAIDGLTVKQVALLSKEKFIISRLWRGQKVIIPLSSTVLRKDDQLLVVTEKNNEESLTLLFGERLKTDWNSSDVDWNHIDAKIGSRILVVSRKVLNGKRLGELQLRNTYGVNVSRVFRGDMKLLATDDLRLQYGDRVTVVGTPRSLEHVESFFGNAVETLNEPEVGSIFLGLVMGLLLGCIPFFIPGVEVPVKLGLAGGTIVMGIIVGALGPRLHFISYTTSSASLMLRKVGLALYLAGLGLEAGADFLPTLMRPEGLLWIGIGIVLTILPLLVLMTAALLFTRMDYATICGWACGAMANPMALTYANDSLDTDTATVSYAAVYPLSMFVRIVIAQLLISLNFL